MTQASTAGFPPGYERLLEEFYRRLSRGGDVGEKVPEKPPSEKPASAPSDPK